MEVRVVIGHLAADPDELRDAGDTKVINFRVAVNTYKHTEWTRCVAWGQDAEFVSEYLRKGQPVAVRGITKTREWTDKDGNKRYSTELNAERFGVRSMGTKQAEGPAGAGPSNDDPF